MNISLKSSIFCRLQFPKKYGIITLQHLENKENNGGVQLPHEYVEEGVSDADLVLLVTTRPTTGSTLAWAVACE